MNYEDYEDPTVFDPICTAIRCPFTKSTCIHSACGLYSNMYDCCGLVAAAEVLNDIRNNGLIVNIEKENEND